jgi:hypothetical protein
MSAELRKVSLKLGKGTYTLRTVLDDNAIKNLTKIISDVTDKLDEQVPQEDQLAIICMTLGWKLEKATRRLKLLLEIMEKMK